MFLCYDPANYDMSAVEAEIDVGSDVEMSRGYK